MSTMGTHIAQSVAGVQQAQEAASPRSAKTDAVRERRALRSIDKVELSAELIDAVNDRPNTTDDQPRQQQHHHADQPPPDDQNAAPPHIDVQA